MKSTVKQVPVKYGSIKPYGIGFALSIGLTLGSYLAVENQLLTGVSLMVLLLSLAVIQLIIQLVFFLHLSQEKAPRWQLLFFLATIGIVLLVVIGSMWIMQQLDYNMLPSRMNDSIIQDEGIPR